MSSYYDCSPESNNTKVKVYGENTSDIINNITGIFMLLTSIGVTFLIIFGFQTNFQLDNAKNILIKLLFLLTFACISIIVGLCGMYNKSPNTSIYGFSSFILIGVYTIFLFLSNNLKGINTENIFSTFFKFDKPVYGNPLIILAILWILSILLYILVYKNVKKSKNRRINSQRKRQRNTAHAIFAFSVVGSFLFALLYTSFLVNKNQIVNKNQMSE